MVTKERAAFGGKAKAQGAGLMETLIGKRRETEVERVEVSRTRFWSDQERGKESKGRGGWELTFGEG